MSARYTVTVHSGTYAPDEHVHCDGWLEKHAVLWAARRLKRRVTVHRHTRMSPFAARWARFWAGSVDQWKPPGGVP